MSGTESLARLFVAAEATEAMRAACGALRRSWGEREVGLRWVRDDGLHVTLKFLGASPRARVTDLRAAIAATTRTTAPFALVTTEAGWFGPRARPRVFRLALSGDDDAAARLAAALEGAVEPLGFAREQRPFSPHLTLARCVQGSRIGRIEELAGDATRAFRGMAIDVEEIVLIESRPAAGGSRYEPLFRFRLDGRSGEGA